MRETLPAHNCKNAVYRRGGINIGNKAISHVFTRKPISKYKIIPNKNYFIIKGNGRIGMLREEGTSGGRERRGIG